MMKKKSLRNKVYDVLKWLSILVFPALATFIGVVFRVWDIPYVDQIVTTINALGTFIGAIIGLSTISYNKEQKEEESKKETKKKKGE